MTELIKNGIISSDSGALYIVGIILCIVVPYLLGSFNFAVIVSALKYKDDVRTHGSGNAGMTNMLRTYGKGAAVLTILGDILKAVFSALFALVLLPGDAFAYVAGLSCMIGHAYPIYFKFKGGKGVLVAAGTMLVLNPAVFGICMVIWALLFSFTKYVSLSSMIAAILFPLINYYFPVYFASGVEKTVLSVLMAAFIVFLHRENIVRLIEGRENKFGKKKPENLNNKLK